MTATCLSCGTEFKPHYDSRGMYCSNKCQREYKYQQWACKIDQTGKFPKVVAASAAHRRYLFERQGGKCAICGRRTWMSKSIPMTFDHINGLHSDWQRENCRLICNNCDAQQPTYKGRNKGRGRKYRRKYYKPV